ncbi:MAG: 1-acyl-sn-glycerol-3-phosphate acyltransferase [Bacteroidaceae bacterium]|nr:1-acyl-sn-glycerol-3-phosphate acyltransferase [Bacteroidaceae bacterium]
MVQFFLKIYDWLEARRKLTVAAVAVIMLLCAMSLCRLHYEEDIARFLPVDTRDSRQTGFLEDLSEQNQVAVIFRYSGDGDGTGSVVEAMDRFEELWFEYDTLEMIPDMSAVADESMALDLIEFVQEHYASFLTEADYRRMDSLLSVPGYVESQLEADRRSLQMMTGSFTRNIIPYDPLNLFSPVLLKLADIGGNGGYRMEDGHIMHASDPIGFIFFESPFGQSESDRNADLVELVESVADAARQGTQVSISVTGAPVIAVTNATRIKTDSMIAVLLAVVGIFLVLWFSFRRIGDMLWIAFTLLFGAVFSLGTIGTFKDSISVIVIGLGSIIVGIAANYPLHFLHSLRDTGDNRRTLREMVTPLLVGNITTVSAFLCLIFLKAQAMHDLALFGSFMLAGTILFTLVFLPVLARPRRTEASARESERVTMKANVAGRWISRAVIAVTAAMLVWGGTAGFDTNLNHINYMTQQQKDDLELLQGGTGMSSMSRLSVLVSMLPETPGNWSEFWASHTWVGDTLAEKGREFGFTETAFAPFARSVGENPEMLTAETLTGESMSDVMKMLVESLSDDFNTVLLLCGFVVFVFLWISFGSLELALLSFLPLTVGWIWILCIMNMLGIQFNIVSIILATFIFGQGDDYTIFITEGLMHEYAYGVRTLDDRRKSVILSAVIMFIGIGTLILAKHPAMRSLAEITILGMFTVVVMAHYLPEWLFKWITMKKGQVRTVPVTLTRLGRSVFAFGFLLLSVIVVTPVALVRFIGGGSRRSERWLHRVLYRFSNIVIRRVPGVGFTLDNSIGETFEKPAVVISNHQSHLDLMCLLMLSEKMVVITNDWVWHNPIYGALIRRAEFIPAAEGVDRYMPQLRSLVERGYSIVVFPEGTRSEDCSIMRFHKGAFHIAQELGLDIVPVCLHGIGHVLPKNDFMLRPGHIAVKVGRRIEAGDMSWGSDARERTKAFHRFYIDWYAQMCRECESAGYWKQYIRHQYMYKGLDIYRSCMRSLDCLQELHAADGETALGVTDCGQGEQSLLTALLNPETEVTGYVADDETLLLASSLAGKPDNLKFELKR